MSGTSSSIHDEKPRLSALTTMTGTDREEGRERREGQDRETLLPELGNGL
jgi:hypothetical protein